MEPLDVIELSISPKKLMDSMQSLKKPIDLMKPLKKPLTLWTLINHRSQIQNTNLSLADIKLIGI
jgi:hypothetical protein